MAKSKEAFRTISEVADWLEVQPHVLRFWESKFSQVRPVKRAGGRRYYRPADMLLIGGIKTLLHDDGMTIKGVQKLLREKGVKEISAMSRDLDDDVPTPDMAIEAEVIPPKAAPAARESFADTAPDMAAAEPITPKRIVTAAADTAAPAAEKVETAATTSDDDATKAVPKKPVIKDADSWKLRRRILSRLIELDHIPSADQPAIAAVVAELQVLRARRNDATA